MDLLLLFVLFSFQLGDYLKNQICCSTKLQNICWIQQSCIFTFEGSALYQEGLISNIPLLTVDAERKGWNPEIIHMSGKVCTMVLSYFYAALYFSRKAEN